MQKIHIFYFLLQKNEQILIKTLNELIKQFLKYLF